MNKQLRHALIRIEQLRGLLVLAVGREAEQVGNRHAQRARLDAPGVWTLNAPTGLFAGGRAVVGVIRGAEVGYAIPGRTLWGFGACDVAPGVLRIPSGGELRIHDGSG